MRVALAHPAKNPVAAIASVRSAASSARRTAVELIVEWGRPSSSPANGPGNHGDTPLVSRMPPERYRAGPGRAEVGRAETGFGVESGRSREHALPAPQERPNASTSIATRRGVSTFAGPITKVSLNCASFRLRPW